VDDDLPRAKVVLADRGYDSDHIRSVITSRGGTPVIMGKANRKIPILVDTITYALRNRVERCFNKLKCSRRFATRYDKTAASYLGFTHIRVSVVVKLVLASTICLLTGERWRRRPAFA
jgi:transposase